MCTAQLILALEQPQPIALVFALQFELQLYSECFVFILRLEEGSHGPVVARRVSIRFRPINTAKATLAREKQTYIRNQLDELFLTALLVV